jgi:AbrB family looped-hinge helix DNA binding protein
MIARLSSRRQLVIPKPIAAALRLREGDLLDVVRKKNTVILTPVDIVERKDAGKRRK